MQHRGTEFPTGLPRLPDFKRLFAAEDAGGSSAAGRLAVSARQMASGKCELLRVSICQLRAVRPTLKTGGPLWRPASRHDFDPAHANAFPALSEDQVERLKRFGTPVNVPHGGAVWTAGTPNISMFVVLEGQVIEFLVFTNGQKGPGRCLSGTGGARSGG